MAGRTRQATRRQPSRDVMQAMLAKFQREFPELASRTISKVDLIEEWADAVESIFDQIDHRQPNRIANWDVGITDVYATGDVRGACVLGEQSYHVGLSIDLEGYRAILKCSCVSGDGSICEHKIAWLHFLRSACGNKRSQLSRRVAAGKFTTGEPDDAIFEPEPSLMAFAELDRLAEMIDIDRQRDELRSSTEEELPPIRTTKQSRLAWRIECDGESLAITPLIQQRKKRGDGFTKGRSISLQTVMQQSPAIMSAEDRRVIDCIERTEHYYGYGDEYELDVFLALSYLIDAPNVDLDGRAATICRDAFVWRTQRRDDQIVCELHTEACLLNDVVASHDFSADSTPLGDSWHLVSDHVSTVAIVDPSNARVHLVRSTEPGVEAYHHLARLPPVPASDAETLYAKLLPLQQVTPLVLPTEFAGPLVEDAFRPAVLLRSNPDGKLDYAFRVRDHAGRLRTPGVGPAVVTQMEPGQQIVRCMTREMQWCRRISEQWGLDQNTAESQIPRESYGGTLEGFDSTMQFISHVQDEQHRDVDELPPDQMALEVLWDKSSEKPIRVLGNLSSQNVRVDIERKRNWFGVTGTCRFGDEEINLQSIMKRIADQSDETSGDFVQLDDGQWARIGDKLRRRLRRLHDATNTERNAMHLDATAAPAIEAILAEGEIEVHAGKAWQECLDRLQRARTLDPVIPESLDATLRDYQIEGYRWMRRLAEWGVGGILADDMGLGKTLQTLAVLLDRADEGPTLVIAPTSVGFNWHRETERFTPTLKAHLYRDTDRREFLNGVGCGDVVICSYGLAMRDVEILSKVAWGNLVLDEAQAIKNSRSKTSKAIAQLDAKWTIALTGTPVENHLGELWSLFRVVSPGVFGGWEQFRQRFAAPIEKTNKQSARQALAERLRPFVLRRTKSEVLTELPPRTEMNLMVDLSKPEREAYERIRLEAIGEIDEAHATVQTQDQRFRILALLTRLRQISCHAGLVDKTFQGNSAKLDQLLETLVELKQEGHRALIFSQFVEHLSLIRTALDKAGIVFEYLDGSTPAQARQERVDAFQNGNADAFLISLKAGGTGLNLTAADYVIHMDPWWNPAVEDQATDRAHRMGQDKPVMVYRIVARGTIEEEILALHDSKRDLVTGVMEGAAAAAKLSNEELIGMIKGNR